jgi:hypothetical protein
MLDGTSASGEVPVCSATIVSCKPGGGLKASSPLP